MKQVAILVLFCIAHLTTYSQQFSSEIFHGGYAVTSSLDTVKGELKYNLETNLLIISQGEKLKSFSSQKVIFFQIRDELTGVVRKFYSFPFGVNYNYKIPIFFELLEDGDKISLLSRERVTQRVISTSFSFARSHVTYELQNTFFFLKEGEITLFSQKKRHLFSVLTENKKQLEEFIDNKRMNVKKLTDLSAIIRFYNSL